MVFVDEQQSTSLTHVMAQNCLSCQEVQWRIREVDLDRTRVSREGRDKYQRSEREWKRAAEAPQDWQELRGLESILDDDWMGPTGLEGEKKRTRDHNDASWRTNNGTRVAAVRDRFARHWFSFPLRACFGFMGFFLLLLTKNVQVNVSQKLWENAMNEIIIFRSHTDGGSCSRTKEDRECVFLPLKTCYGNSFYF